MKTYEPFSIVVVPFPFTDKIQTKKRPALAISDINHQIHTQHITLSMITTAKNSKWHDDCPIQDLSAAGLTAPSIVRQKIFTIDSRLIVKQIGKLSPIDEKAIRKIFIQHLRFT